MQAVEARGAGNTSQVANVFLFGFVLFLLCLFGILTRPGADLASFWPANAFMFGMLIRFPTLKTPLSWIACAAGFALADLLTGGTVLKTVVLNLGNLAAITVGYLVFSRFDRADQRLSRPTSVLFMLVAITSASLTAGLIGTVADPLLFGGAPLDALLYWSATELVNYVAFLPMILTFPDDAMRRLRRIVETPPKMIRLLPLLALVGTALAGAAIGGPGAVAFPILALLWCAVSYSLFVTSCLAFAFVSWTLLAISTGYLPVADNFTDRRTLLSIRFAVSLMGLAPIVVASVMAAREELMQRLLFLSSHDQMTGLLNRAAFLAHTSNRLDGKAAKNVAVLMLDIDHFKSINDQYGHAAGDRVLIAFAEILKNNIRKGDAAGRFGGEEFAVFLDGCSSSEAQEVASRINAVFAATPVSLDEGRVVKATVSVGLAMSAWATAMGYRTGDNPASRDGPLAHLLPPLGKMKREKKHHAAVPYREVPAVVAEIRKLGSTSANALLFTILTAARTGETLGATWDEIDLDEKLWTIPAARMKAGAEHKVPLSDEVIRLLNTLPRTTDGNPHLFPGPRAKTLSNMAMLQCLRGIRDDGATVHGFRASFSTWAREQTDFSPEIIEAALAHTQSDKVVAAYARTTFLDRRRELMQVWAGFCMGG